jgi:hypothetical protein
MSDFSELETVGCDGHHIKTDPAGNFQGTRLLAGP